MANQDQGPATNNAELWLGATTNNEGVSIEVHVPVGTPSVGPASQPAVDPQAATFLYNVTGGGNNGNVTLTNAVNTTVLPAGAPGVTIKFAIPA